MKYNFYLYLFFFQFFVIGNVQSQSTAYIIGEFPSIFSNLENQMEQGDIDSAIVLCDQILAKESDDKIQGIAYFYKGQVEALLNRNSQFEGYYLDAIDIFKISNFEKGLAMVYCKEADFYFFQRFFSTADSLFDISISYAEKLNLYQILADAYQKKATISDYNQESGPAIDFLKTALQFADLKKDQQQVKNIINQISTNYHAYGKLDSAIFYFQKGLDLKLEMDDVDGLISDFIALGNLYRERGDYEKAQLNLTEALKIAEEERDTFSTTTIYSELGDIYSAQKIWKVAESYYVKGLKLAQMKNSRFAEAGCYKKLGNIYHLQNKDTAAIEHFEAALKIHRQLNNKMNEAEVLMSLSQIYKDGNQFAKAKKLLIDALATRKNSQDMLSMLSIKMALAEIEIQDGKPQKGITYAEECLEAFEKMEDKEGLRQVYFLLSNAYAQTGDFKKAYQRQLDFSTVNEGLISIDRAKAIKKYDLLYTTEKKDKEIAQQKIEIEKQQVEIQRRNNQLLMLGGGLALIGLLAALLIFINRKNKQINEQKIEVLKKEKETQGLKSVIEGEEKERKRIARELHDGLGAVLATVKMQISSIQHQFPQAQSLSAYQKSESLIDDACRTVREISHNLMPHVLEQEGLEFAIEDLCQTLSKHSDLEIEFNYFGKEQELTQVFKTTIFRITQELLKNIIKHAQAKEVIVQLTIEESEIILIVEDDGKGFDISKPNKGIGLENIRTRTAYLNGTLEIDSTAGQGSTFTILFPLNKKNIQ